MTIEEIEELIAKNGSITAQPLRDLVVTVVLEAVEAEREACAKVCEETTAAWTQHLYNSGCVDCAAAIRARGEK
jgi:hypothetical protein